MSMPQNFSSLWVHLIWTTKNREPLITKKIKWPLYNKIKEICREHEYYLDHINGIEDHVHLLVGIKPKHSISDVVKNIKGLSWEWMRKENISENYFSWQDGFAAFTVSPSELNKVRAYIRNQEKHHKKMSFENEINIFKKNIKPLHSDGF
jgi:putative transposase